MGVKKSENKAVEVFIFIYLFFKSHTLTVKTVKKNHNKSKNFFAGREILFVLSVVSRRKEDFANSSVVGSRINKVAKY